MKRLRLKSIGYNSRKLGFLEFIVDYRKKA